MINIDHKGDLTSIIVQNSLSKQDTKVIIDTVKSDKKLEITFIDIGCINIDLILALDRFKEKLDLSTNNKTLWIYLKKIGIDLKLHHHIKNTQVFGREVSAIAIGGSAGSLKSMVDILSKVPYCDIAVFVVMHILPDQESKLEQILQLNTKLKVKEPLNGERVQKGYIYVAPPDLHMSVEKGFIRTLNTPKVNFCRPAIDVLFESLSKEYKDGLITVLTCGYLDDGSRSLETVKKNNGTSLIIDPNQCEANDIPLNAMATKNYDFIFDPEDMGEYLKSRLNLTLNLEDRVVYLIKEIYKKYHYDFTDYDKNSLIRRVELLRQELGIKHFNDFESLVLNDCEVFELLFDKLSINVSEFFRDIETFKQVEKDLLSVLKKLSHIRIWCAGSSKGQEPYSLAMMLDEYGLLDKTIIYATDFNGLVLEQAKNGIYSKKEFEQCKKSLGEMGFETPLEKWFDVEKNYVTIKEEIKKRVHFFQHNLVTDGEINEFQVVFCRNVIIYFNEKLQKKVFKLIYDSLVENGFLVLGDSEHVADEKKFERLAGGSNSKIFKKQ